MTIKKWQWTYLRPSPDCGSLFPDRKPSIISVSRFLWWRKTVQDTLPATRPNESQRHVPDINNFEMRLFSEQRSTAYLNVFVERKIIGSSFLLFIIPDEEQRNRKIKLLSLIPYPHATNPSPLYCLTLFLLSMQSRIQGEEGRVWGPYQPPPPLPPPLPLS